MDHCCRSAHADSEKHGTRRKWPVVLGGRDLRRFHVGSIQNATRQEPRQVGFVTGGPRSGRASFTQQLVMNLVGTRAHQQECLLQWCVLLPRWILGRSNKVICKYFIRGHSNVLYCSETKVLLSEFCTTEL